MFKYVIFALACVAIANAGVLPSISAYSTGITHASAPVVYSAPVVASAPVYATAPLAYSAGIAHHTVPLSLSAYSAGIAHAAPIAYSAGW